MRRGAIVALIGPLLCYVACDAANDDSGSSGNGTPSATTGAGGSGTGGTGAGAMTSTMESSSSGFDPVTSSTGSGVNCDALPDEDKDMDGFTINQGDCNDCDANVNPNAIEVIGGMGSGGNGAGGMYEPADEDCDGMADNIAPTCDGNLAANSNDPMDAARAVDLCKVTTGATDWGVVEAKWINSDGGPPPSGPEFHLGHGMLPSFGPNVNVQNGGMMLALSSGTARPYGHPEYQSVGGFTRGYNSPHPTGFPKESPSCPGVTTGAPYDVAAVELTVRAPSNAYGFRFNFNFFTYEWPGYVCSTYNDFFVAEMLPFPQGQMDGNISFDQLNNPVSVNNAFLEVCGCSGGPPCTAGNKSFTCSLGNTELMGTGFGSDTEGTDHGATSWLLTQAPVAPGAEFQIRWITYDSGDGALDSTTLIDNWEWIAEPGTTVGTEPVPDPQ